VVREIETVPGIERDELEVVLSSAVKQLKKFVEQERSGKNGGSGVVPKPTALKNLRATAQSITAIDQRHRVTLSAESKSGSHSAETRTYHNGSRLFFRPQRQSLHRGVVAAFPRTQGKAA
jgi:hypothetical protein